LSNQWQDIKPIFSDPDYDFKDFSPDSLKSYSLFLQQTIKAHIDEIWLLVMLITLCSTNHQIVRLAWRGSCLGDCHSSPPRAEKRIVIHVLQWKIKEYTTLKIVICSDLF